MSRYREWRERRRAEAADRAIIREGRRRGLASMGLPAPHPAIEGGRGMYLDPRQVPMTLMQPAMDAGQPVAPAAPRS